MKPLLKLLNFLLRICRRSTNNWLQLWKSTNGNLSFKRHTIWLCQSYRPRSVSISCRADSCGVFIIFLERIIGIYSVGTHHMKLHDDIAKDNSARTRSQKRINHGQLNARRIAKLLTIGPTAICQEKLLLLLLQSKSIKTRVLNCSHCQRRVITERFYSLGCHFIGKISLTHLKVKIFHSVVRLSQNLVQWSASVCPIRLIRKDVYFHTHWGPILVQFKVQVQLILLGYTYVGGRCTDVGMLVYTIPRPCNGAGPVIDRGSDITSNSKNALNGH